MNILGILIFILGLLLAVALHELGHLIPAKKFGVKVSQYFVGFGPTIFSRLYHGTEYGIKWILLGGYVRLCGMLAPAKANTKIYTKDGQLTMAEQARRESAAELALGEEQQAFWRLPPAKKLVVMFGGPFVNFLLAILFFAIVWLGIGVSTLSNRIATISPCIDANLSECDSTQATPAAKSQLRIGDEIRSWDGQEINDWNELQNAIKNSGTGVKKAEVWRDGQVQQIPVEVVLAQRPLLKDGMPVVDDHGAPIISAQPYIGIGPQIIRKQQSITQLPAQIGALAVNTAKIVAALPVHLWNVGVSLFSDSPRDSASVIGIVGIADIAGSITGSESESYTFASRAGDMLMLFASLNMSLFIFNLIPLLPLDGGHILGALIEQIRKSLAKLRGKPDPGAFDTARLLPLSNIVVFFFLAMTFFLIVADIVKPAF